MPISGLRLLDNRLNSSAHDFIRAHAREHEGLTIITRILLSIIIIVDHITPLCAPGSLSLGLLAGWFPAQQARIRDRAYRIAGGCCLSAHSSSLGIS